MPPLLHRLAALEREQTQLLHARDLADRALGEILERLAACETRLLTLEGRRAVVDAVSRLETVKTDA
jgi:hypothetical protein